MSMKFFYIYAGIEIFPVFLNRNSKAVSVNRENLNNISMLLEKWIKVRGITRSFCGIPKTIFLYKYEICRIK